MTPTTRVISNEHKPPPGGGAAPPGGAGTAGFGVTGTVFGGSGVTGVVEGGTAVPIGVFSSVTTQRLNWTGGDGLATAATVGLGVGGASVGVAAAEGVARGSAVGGHRRDRAALRRAADVSVAGHQDAPMRNLIAVALTTSALIAACTSAPANISNRADLHTWEELIEFWSDRAGPFVP